MSTGRFRRTFLGVKAHHTEAAIRALAPHLAEDGYVVSAQNGLNEQVIAGVVGEARTVGCFVNFDADYLSPGVVQYSGHGAVVVGELDGRPSERIAAVHRLMQAFEPGAILTDNIWGYLWGKLVYGTLLFATALTNDSIGDVLDNRRYRPVLTRLALEVGTVAKAAGIRQEAFDGFDPAAFAPGAPADRTEASFDELVAHNRRSLKSHSGIWRDLAVRKRRTEVGRPDRPDRRYRPEARRADAPDGAPRRHDPRDRRRQESTVSLQSRRAGARRSLRMNIAFDGKVVIVTGAAHGFGRAIALAFAERGARVHACDVNDAGLAETGALGGTRVQTHHLDVGDREGVQATVGEIVQADGRIDILVNNAGGVRGQVGRPIEEISEADWQTIFDVNLSGAFFMCQAVAPAMKRQGAGRIVNISSGAGLGISLTGIQAYASAKAGQIGLTRQLAHELGPFGITVNNVAPGFVRSNPTTERQWEAMGAEGQQRLIDAIALQASRSARGHRRDAVMFFASDHAGWITGQVISVDGGK